MLILAWASTASGQLDPRGFRPAPLKPPQALPQSQMESLAVTPDLEEQLVEFFSSDRCDRVRAAAPRAIQFRLSPVVAAVVAYCQPDSKAAQALFDWAEGKEPNHDTIFVLHARYLWRQGAPEKSLPLWAKVALITRNQATKILAQQYIEGTAQGDEFVAVGKKENFFVTVSLGASHESNPIGNPVSTTLNPSWAANSQLLLDYARDTKFGSFAADYALINNRYFTEHGADLLEQDLSLPFDVQAGKSEDVVFRPFGSYLTLGNQPYQSFGGIGIRGVAYRDTYKQYVQASIYDDWYYRQEFKNQAGTHFRFDYNWEYYPYPWYVNGGLYFEHVRAARDTDNADAISVTYSHNDVGLLGYFEWNARLFTPGVLFRSVLREDDDTSSYPLVTTGQLTTKRRQDLMIEVTPSVTIPIENNLHLYLWFSYNRTYSNLGVNDYADRNLTNTTVGGAIRAYLIR